MMPLFSLILITLWYVSLSVAIKAIISSTLAQTADFMNTHFQHCQWEIDQKPITNPNLLKLTKPNQKPQIYPTRLSQVLQNACPFPLKRSLSNEDPSFRDVWNLLEYFFFLFSINLTVSHSQRRMMSNSRLDYMLGSTRNRMWYY